MELGSRKLAGSFLFLFSCMAFLTGLLCTGRRELVTGLRELVTGSWELAPSKEVLLISTSIRRLSCFTVLQQKKEQKTVS